MFDSLVARLGRVQRAARGRRGGASRSSPGPDNQDPLGARRASGHGRGRPPGPRLECEATRVLEVNPLCAEAPKSVRRSWHRVAALLHAKVRLVSIMIEIYLPFAFCLLAHTGIYF